MSEAYLCDRCGDVLPGEPEVKVGTNSGVKPGGDIQASASSPPSPSGPTGISRPGPLDKVASQPTASYNIERGDLCEDCAEAFADWWTQADDEAGGE